jgi:hypothetical protein
VLSCYGNFIKNTKGDYANQYDWHNQIVKYTFNNQQFTHNATQAILNIFVSKMERAINLVINDHSPKTRVTSIHTHICKICKLLLTIIDDIKKDLQLGIIILILIIIILYSSMHFINLYMMYHCDIWHVMCTTYYFQYL